MTISSLFTKFCCFPIENLEAKIILTNRDLTDIKTQNLLYITWVRSRLEYASVVWYPYTKINIVKLEQIQRRAIRLIIGRDFSEHERLQKLNLLPLQYLTDLREVTDLLFLFKCFKNPYILNILNCVDPLL